MATYRNNAVYDDIARCMQPPSCLVHLAVISTIITVALFRYFTQRRLSFATRRRVQRTLYNCTPYLLQHLDSFISTFFATFAHKIPPAYNNEHTSSGKSSRDRL